MLTLNRAAAETARAAGGVHAATDITGFGLLGHASEMADKSGVGLQINAWAVPLLPGTEEYAEAGLHRRWSGAEPGLLRGQRRRDSFRSQRRSRAQTILFDPQTSGGLLFAVDAAQADAFETAFTDAGVPLWRDWRGRPGRGHRRLAVSESVTRQIS